LVSTKQSVTKYFIEQVFEYTHQISMYKVNCTDRLCYSISDAYGNIIGKFKEDSAPVKSISLADQKAKTSAFFGIPTEQVDEKRFHSLSGSTNLMGGYPIFSSTHEVIGGLGIAVGEELENQFFVRLILNTQGFYVIHPNIDSSEESILYNELSRQFDPYHKD
jgi:uncharacterized protein GlcG (DUF336 family)